MATKGKQPRRRRPPTGRPMGRPPVITSAIVEQVAAAMAGGMPEEMACELHGVNPQTYGPAVARSEEFQAIKRKHGAKFIEGACKTIAKGGEIVKMEDAEGNTRDVRLPWQGLAWLLERRYPQWFCVKSQQQTVSAVVQTEIALTPEQEADLRRFARQMYVEKPNDQGHLLG